MGAQLAGLRGLPTMGAFHSLEANVTHSVVPYCLYEADFLNLLLLATTAIFV